MDEISSGLISSDTDPFFEQHVANKTQQNRKNIFFIISD
jgi:hypothetical protein